MPSQLEHPTHEANDDLDPRTRDVDDSAYSDVPRFCQDYVWMVACIDDRAPLIGTRRFALSRAELANRHVAYADGRGTLRIKPEALRDGGRGIDNPPANEWPAIIDHLHSLAAIA